jgi:hypothetical protein
MAVVMPSLELAIIPSAGRLHESVPPETQFCAGYGGESYVEWSRPQVLIAGDEGKIMCHSPVKDTVVSVKKKKAGPCIWTDEAVKALVDAKYEELKRLMNKKDTKFHMMRAPLKWQIIEEYMKQAGFTYTWSQCRDKFGNESTVYKRMTDHQNMSGREDYFSMSPDDRKSYGLPTD